MPVSTRFLCTYNIWDDEWWWESRLDLMICVCISTRFSENLWDSRLENLIRPRLDFMCGFPEIFARWVDKPPVLWYARFTHNTSAHSIQILCSLPTEYLQITKRYNLLFYFLKTFYLINLKVFCILWYILWVSDVLNLLEWFYTDYSTKNSIMLAIIL